MQWKNKGTLLQCGNSSSFIISRFQSLHAGVEYPCMARRSHMYSQHDTRLRQKAMHGYIVYGSYLRLLVWKPKSSPSHLTIPPSNNPAASSLVPAGNKGKCGLGNNKFSHSFPFFAGKWTERSRGYK
uniref:Uncharacterized protein n=1 Tax=Morchella brunnea TaxID=1174671 RepID=A0A8K1MEQ3_9PEZI|nr:hypothetical protein LK370_mgp247 [Morchella brunnea]UBU98344.1 hypothetical protein [Morchella brunnea]